MVDIIDVCCVNRGLETEQNNMNDSHDASTPAKGSDSL
jgi:hypothetical protein